MNQVIYRICETKKILRLPFPKQENHYTFVLFLCDRNTEKPPREYTNEKLETDNVLI